MEQVKIGTTTVAVKRDGDVIHLLDLEKLHGGMTLTNAMDERFQSSVLSHLGLNTDNPNRFTWVLYHTDSWITRYGAGGFAPLGDLAYDAEFRDEMHRLYGDGDLY
ncbi:hypothetical protein SD70_02675 [Gordoniibacillus kamchatkensis]|uniref:Uncharacterized protein n=1 Tax=Gordoniibacillus kamchatkensis TaxID=1590651 RepID=A0ABR5AM42_9BACL|nr:hypothetical protein [Paenibacillus sp. VKM B-2647]KIL42104.1 hypothetical protein SD70_02675 [Paenibacillus sp. VKM B-2647]